MQVAAGEAAHRKALLEERAALAAVETVMVDRQALPLDQTGLLTLAAAAAVELVQHFIPAALAL